MYTYTHFSDTLCVNPSGEPLDTLRPVEAKHDCGNMSALKDIMSDIMEAKALVDARGHHGGSSATAPPATDCDLDRKQPREAPVIVAWQR